MKEFMKGIDELYALFKKRKRIPLKEAAALLSIAEGTALKWAKALQDDGLIEVEFKNDETILVWRGGSGKPPEFPETEEPKTAAEAEANFQRLVSDYEHKMEEIKKKSAELHDLGKERADIIYTKYIPLERKFEAELQLLHDQLTEKEKQISELEKRIRGMPGKVESIEQHTRKLEEIEAYARKNISETKIRVQAEIGRIREAQTAVEVHLKEVTMRIEAQTLKLKLIEKELIRLKKIEQWMEMQQADLERNLSDFSIEKKASLKQYSTLRATMTADYIRNYVKELGDLKEKHAHDIHDIRKKEEHLNEKVKEAKKDLARLTTESKLILERFEKVSKKKKHAERALGEFDKERKQFERDLNTLSTQNIE